MAYQVKSVDNIYTDADDTGAAVEIQRYLNEQEAEGWKLVGILPDHRSWDEDMDFSGFTGAMFILHKD